MKNHLRVRPRTPSDKTVAARVEGALERSPYVEDEEILVSVDNGVAELSGIVESYYEKAEADDVAARVYGVAEVDNNLVVRDTGELVIADPYVDEDWYVYDYDWYDYPDVDLTTVSDWEILEDIQDELFWSPYVDSDEVTVTVDGGVATLTGTVDSWTEREAATENAREGGALAVDNDLAVRYGPDFYSP